jgi:acetyl esterase/lipase
MAFLLRSRSRLIRHHHPRVVTSLRPVKRLLRLVRLLALALVRVGLDRLAFRVDRDVVYGRVGATPLLLDLYRPHGESPSLLPLVVYLHGGGWYTGDKSRPPLRDMARRGVAVASVDYRLSGVAPFPAAVEDAKCAVRFLRANAARYGLDPERIGVMGASAGGQLALLLAFTSSGVRCACAWFAPTDFTRPLEGVGNALPLYLGGTLAERRDTYVAASPITHATTGAPPILLVHGDRDSTVPLEQSEILLARLEALGVAAELVVVEDAEHSFHPAGGARETRPPRDEVLRLTEAFFERHLRAD